MSSFPSLSTQRIVLSSFSTLTDTSAVFAYGSDPEVARFTSWMPHKSPADSAAWIEQINDTDSAESGRRHHCWAIRIRGDGTAVGAIEFAQGPSDVARVDFVLARSLWAKGLMTEAVEAVIGWAFRALPELSSILSGGLAANVGSIRVMQKCGLTLERKEYLAFAKFGDTTHEVLHYRIEREAWTRLHP